MVLSPPGRDTFLASSLAVAPRLLGAVLRHESAEGAVALRITEVEAYTGEGLDPGSHAFRGRTKRNAAMYGEPGRLYAYFTYGMHVCANVVCSPEGEASAVLLRGAEVVEGVALAGRRRAGASGRRIPPRDLARGPARLVVAAGIGLADDGADLLAPPFGLLLPSVQPEYATGPRTGVSGAGGGAAFPWRYWLPGEPSVSPYKRHPQSHP
ncbi:3-methyladenine DNA glycosylase [Leifsonia xyli subsp. cynodontis DSM 46306]|uniref:Putative 3-methyladenine DNA glycosylase n=1 Tax=Leifsonia xyli subsp. cynodontis DSM 46306 TaxID=1389489 RepID=U3P9D0_LEIXC|nr:DNA-3-methyladenine glycosylase [Leifsonia xyli]AGW42134.1 3-methyladenine DNA glycosylase [Leifsonia xyli subsp. cynodontis DSM 46306]